MSAPVTLHRGDCLEVLARLPADSFDAIVTDPPYHLTATKGAAKGFMGREWDGGDIAFRPETWAACLRVLKPGGHLLAFNAARTFHHMAVAIEAAGFEVRDAITELYDTGPAWSAFLDSLTPAQAQGFTRAVAGGGSPLLAWVYGCGMPKSHNLAKAIDRMRDDRAAVCRITSRLADLAEANGITRRDLDAALGTSDMGGWFLSRLEHRCHLPKPDQWDILRDLLKWGDDDGLEAEFLRLSARKGELGDAWKAAEVIGTHDAAAGVAKWRKEYEGGGDPSARDIRALNSDAAREWEGWGTALKPALEPITLARKPLGESSALRQVLSTGTGGLNIAAAAAPGDRHPANVVTDGSAAILQRFPVDGDGTSARFFYSGKADKADRAGSDHPTVKPQALMRWLVRLVTARGGLVLDPFAGSGSTGWAAAAEGRRCELIEREAAMATTSPPASRTWRARHRSLRKMRANRPNWGFSDLPRSRLARAAGKTSDS